MIAHTCCHTESIRIRETSKTRRVIATTKWIVPTAILALMPKCPMCLAAYIALGTGLGISVPAANWIRGGLIVICFCSIAWLAATGNRPAAAAHHR